MLLASWTRLDYAPPLDPNTNEGLGHMILLSNGTVMANVHGRTDHGNADARSTWWLLTPDNHGDYIHGTWSPLASMHYKRYWFPAEVLPNGKVFVAGGEHGNGQETAETYDPVRDTWTETSPNTFLADHNPTYIIEDAPSEILPDGRVLLGGVGYIDPLTCDPAGGYYCYDDPRTYIYDPGHDTWSLGPSRLDETSSTEEMWVLLPDHSIVTIDDNSPTASAERYLPDSTQWVHAGTPPNLIGPDADVGAGLRLPDGRIIFLGTGGPTDTALYSRSGGVDAWQNGPRFPPSPTSLAFTGFEAPAAMMPNGKIIAALHPGADLDYPTPTYFSEYTPDPSGIGQFSAAQSQTFPVNSAYTRMLMLPSGQVLWSWDDPHLYVYTPDGGPKDEWRPTITNVTDHHDRTFTLTGTQLNGISEGAVFGDDAKMSTNYPLVRLVAPNNLGTVYYARTYNWSNTGVATGTLSVSTDFDTTGIPAGTYTLYVVANGIPSLGWSNFMIGDGGGGGAGSGEVVAALAASMHSVALTPVATDVGVRSVVERGLASVSRAMLPAHLDQAVRTMVLAAGGLGRSHSGESPSDLFGIGDFAYLEAPDLLAPAI
jgi:hypothetical protein